MRTSILLAVCMAGCLLLFQESVDGRQVGSASQWNSNELNASENFTEKDGYGKTADLASDGVKSIDSNADKDFPYERNSDWSSGAFRSGFFGNSSLRRSSGVLKAGGESSVLRNLDTEEGSAGVPEKKGRSYRALGETCGSIEARGNDWSSGVGVNDESSVVGDDYQSSGDCESYGNRSSGDCGSSGKGEIDGEAARTKSTRSIFNVELINVTDNVRRVAARQGIVCHDVCIRIIAPMCREECTRRGLERLTCLLICYSAHLTCYQCRLQCHHPLQLCYTACHEDDTRCKDVCVAEVQACCAAFRT